MLYLEKSIIQHLRFDANQVPLDLKVDVPPRLRICISVDVASRRALAFVVGGFELLLLLSVLQEV